MFSLQERIATEVASGRSVEEAAVKLGVPSRDAHAAFKQYTRAAALRGRAADPRTPTAAKAATVEAPAVAQALQIRSSVTSDVALQVLWCEGGQHEWQRPSRRGRKPRHCADHQD